MKKTAEEVLSQYPSNQEYPDYFHEFNVIQAMQTFADQDNWISVDEELPPFTIDPDDGEPSCSDFVLASNGQWVWRRPCCLQTNGTWYMDGDYAVNTVDVKFWQPLPAPPKIK